MPSRNLSGARPEITCGFGGGIGRVRGLHRRLPGRRRRNVGKASAVPGCDSSVLGSPVCRTVFLEHQDRFGSLALSPAALFAGSAILIATAVTRPITSASDS